MSAVLPYDARTEGEFAGLNRRHVAASIERALAALSSGVFALDDYGAAGDGTTDDAPALTTALAAIAARGAGILDLGHMKSYALGSKVTIACDNVWIRGRGKGVSTIIGQAGAHYDDMLYATGRSGLILSDLTLDGNKANRDGTAAAFESLTRQHVVDFPLCSDLLVYNAEVKGGLGGAWIYRENYNPPSIAGGGGTHAYVVSMPGVIAAKTTVVAFSALPGGVTVAGVAAANQVTVTFTNGNVGASDPGAGDLEVRVSNGSGVNLAIGGGGENKMVYACEVTEGGIYGRAADGIFAKGDNIRLVNFLAEDCWDTAAVLENCNYSTIDGFTARRCASGGAITNAGNADIYGNSIRNGIIEAWRGGNTGGTSFGHPLSTATGVLYNTSLENLKYRPDTDSTGSAINLRTTNGALPENFTMTNIEIDGGPSHGVEITGRMVTLQGSRVWGVTGSPVRILGTCEHIKVRDCPLLKAPALGFGAYITTGASDIRFVSNYFENGAYGIYAEAASVGVLSLWNEFSGQTTAREGPLGSTVFTVVKRAAGQEGIALGRSEEIRWLKNGNHALYEVAATGEHQIRRDGDVNYLALIGATTGNDPAISAKGTDTDIDLILQGKGNGAVLPGRWAIAKGTTAQRPATPSANGAHVFFDVTLGKPVWWNSTQWVDATGTPV